MKKILIILCTLFFVVGCKKENGNINAGKVNYSYKYDFILKDRCNNEVSEYYNSKNQKIYFVCLDEMYIQEGDYKITLKDYLHNKNLETEMQNMTDMMEVNEIYKDGGTTIYRDKNKKLSSNGFTIIKCNTLDGNKNIYFGTSNLEYIEDFCKNN